MSASALRPPDFSSDNYILSVEGLNLFFRRGNERIQVLSDVSFNVQRQEIFGIVGESGCGKSLTAMSILRLLPPGAYVEGKILFDGKRLNLLELPSRQIEDIRGKEIGMIFQEPMTSLNPVFTIGEQIAEVLMVHEGLSKRDALDRAVELLRQVKIPSPELRIRDYPHKLSGGMRQRVMIAMAIACNPTLLIADEPTTALDVTIQAEILSLLMEIKDRRGMSVILITHDLGIISETAQRIAVMYAGRVVEVMSVQTLLSGPSHPYTIGLLESLPVRRGERLNPIPGTVPSPAEMPPGCKFAPRCRYAIKECNEQEPPLSALTGDHLVRCIKADEVRASLTQAGGS